MVGARNTSPALAPIKVVIFQHRLSCLVYKYEPPNVFDLHSVSGVKSGRHELNAWSGGSLSATNPKYIGSSFEHLVSFEEILESITNFVTLLTGEVYTGSLTLLYKAEGAKHKIRINLSDGRQLRLNLTGFVNVLSDS